MLDTITVQALINRYPTVCGMTGTALAAGEQLRQFYKLGVSPIPPNTPNVREDEADRVYITAAAKTDAIVEHIAEVHATGQPVLVGTRDVAESEELHERLRQGAACRPWCSTPRTTPRRPPSSPRRARWTRSRCPRRWPAAAPTSGSAAPTRPSHDEVADLGGLHVIGTGRHHTERLDNQLRGRAGRQGDPGSSVFFSSWEDDLVVAHLDAAASCRPQTDEDGRISARRPRSCWTTRSGSPRAGCSTCTPTPGATTS